jgi:hypothetical protein
LSTGYTRIAAGSGDILPGARAILQWHEHGVLVSELTVAATSLLQSGRILASESDRERTGIGITNPNPFTVTIDFNFTDATGQDFGHGSFSLAANNQISRFLDEAPFNGGRSIQGTFTFRSSSPVAFMAIRGFVSARGDFLMSSLPVTRINTSPLTTTVFPHWILGAGWTSEFILVNPSEVLSTGQLVLTDTAGEILETLSYSVPARSSRRIIPITTGSTLRTGSARLIVNGGALPSGAALLRFSTADGVVVETIDPAIAPGLSFRGYGESSAVARTGLVVANTTGQQASVTVDLRNLSGAFVGTTHFDIPPLGQRVALIDELPGIITGPAFQGSVVVTSLTPIAVTLIRTRTNSRGDYVISSIPPDNLGDLNLNAESFFPLFALGGGATMEFVLLNSQGSGLQSGGVQFLTDDGRQFRLNE